MDHIPLSDRVKQQAIRDWVNKKRKASSRGVKEGKEKKPDMPKTQAAFDMPGINKPADHTIEKSFFKKKIALYKEKLKRNGSVCITKSMHQFLQKKLKKADTSLPVATTQYSYSKVSVASSEKPKIKKPQLKKPRLNKPNVVRTRYSVVV